jgi:membrane fusion protein (multidrug efflux system)
MQLTPQMKKMLVITGIVFGIVFGIYTVKKILFLIFISTYEPPPVTISSSTAKTENWQSYLTSVGTITAVNGVDISSESAGIVKEINFQSGQFVNQGDLLVQLDTSVEEAQLKDNESRLKLMQINYNRDKTLLIKNVTSQSVVDTDLANLEQAEAGVEATKARILQKTVRAPFSGKIGIRQINLGEYVPAGNAMVTLQSLDPLYVRFNLPEQYVPELYLQQPVDVDVNLNSQSNKPIHGTITAINSRVDQNTRNILLQATIPNKSLQLYPGMFGLVKIWLRTQNNVVTLPQTAVSYSLHGDSVFLIKDKGKKGHPDLSVTRQYVKVGERREGVVVIQTGIKAGDQVATSGQLKLQNDTHVVIDNSVEL